MAETRSGGPVAVVGTGLIGASLGLALRKASAEVEVWGYDADPGAAAAARAAGALTSAAPSLAAAVAGARVVVLAVPTDEIVAAAAAVAALPGAAAVTDVGSAKEEIVAAATPLLGPRFVGGHPMAGSERAGVAAARDDLFHGASWVLTPTEVTSERAYGRVREMVASVGARPVALDAADHDALIARLSHLPQLAASALVDLAASAGDEEALLGLAAGGFRDVTRIAASDPHLWIAILRANRRSILEALDRFAARLGDLRTLLAESEWSELQAFLTSARRARVELFRKPSYAGEPHDLVLLIPDRPGVLAEVTTAAGQIGANIEDLKIFHSPEGGTGRLELTISGAPAAAELAARLTGLGYRVQQDPLAT